ncbi:hypothetical protein JXI42_00940 [bacterium]|nr:hypothetical protein [bacterium]
MTPEQKKERFEQKYKDKGGFAKFKQMINNLKTLEEIGEHFGFSRQNAAGLFYSFFGRAYGHVQEKRRVRKHEKTLKKYTDIDKRIKDYRDDGKKRSWKKMFYTKKVINAAKREGLKVDVEPLLSGRLKVFINGYYVNIAGTDTQTIYHIPKKRKPSVYYRFAIPEGHYDFSIFVLNLKGDKFTYYIIPYDMIKHLTLITLKDRYIPYRKKAEGRGALPSKYAPFRNAWNLLKTPKTTR